MKNNRHKSIIKKLLIVLVAFIAFVVLMNDVVMPWYVSSPEKSVPKVLGMQEASAVRLLKDSTLVPVISDTTYDQQYPKGTIIYQTPSAHDTVKEGRRIYLFISGGEPVVAVPDLKGKSIRDAKFALERLGLSLGHIDSIASNNPKDMIFNQQFAQGTPIKTGDSVGVSMSIGERLGSITVPNLIGKSLAEAEIILADSSLKVGKINYQKSFSLLPNTVLDQYPSKGNKLNRGDSVDLFVTKNDDSANDNINQRN